MKRTAKRLIALTVALVLTLGLFSTSYGETTTGMLDNAAKFYPDYSTLEEAEADGKRLNLQIAEEGMVLLKNDGTLPLDKNTQFVTLLGAASVNIVAGGTGSGSGTGTEYSLADSFERVGFSVNKQPLRFYESNKVSAVVTSGDMGNISQVVENDPATYPAPFMSSFSQFGDLAVLTLSRIGGEGADCATHDVSTHSNPEDHYLQLDDNEQKLLAMIKEQKAAGVFKRFIVIVNTANVMELGALNDDPDVNAILWIGDPGENGILAVGEILTGAVNPSGHVSDTWPRSLKDDPTWTNFGDNSQVKDSEGNQGNTTFLVDDNGTITESPIRMLEMREGIYVGYRWYETMAAVKNEAEVGSGDAWYQEAVVYPFGYGLSYTTFDWALDGTDENGAITAADEEITVAVKVTNTGSVAGKDVVQLYVNPPYTAGGIEKASANLVGFAKTSLLQPGESETVTITVAAQDLASYDWSDANGNGFKGYELEEGDYILSAKRNAHESVINMTRTVADGILCKTDLVSGYEIKNVFSGDNGLESYATIRDSLVANSATRADLKQPATVEPADRMVTKEFMDELTSTESVYWSYQDKKNDLWYATAVPASWTQASDEEAAARENSQVAIQLKEMSGVPYAEVTRDENGALVSAEDENTAKWDAYMNQLTWDELRRIVSYGGYTTIAIPEIGRVREVCVDGPVQFGKCTFWCCAGITAATFNKELAYRQGRIVGNESILTGSAGWYGPGMNTHRSAFGGRNFEYYSEDGILAGSIAANVVLGATEKGVNVYVKHMLLNDQETNRGYYGGVRTYCNEQAIREIYARPFEYSMKYGHTTAAMTSCQGLGNGCCQVNYSLLESLVRGEWGFTGMCMTDFYHANMYLPVGLLVRTGLDMPLGNAGSHQVEGTWSAELNMVLVPGNKEDAAAADTLRIQVDANPDNTEAAAQLAALETVPSPTQYYNVRKAAQRILYVLANTNNMDNGITSEMIGTREVEIVVGTNAVANVKVDEEALGVGFASYASDSLPEGYAVADDGTISASVVPSFAGEIVEFNVAAMLDGYTFNYPVKAIVKGDLTYEGTALDQFNGDVQGKVQTHAFAPNTVIGSGFAMASVTNVIYSVADGALPEGVTLAQDGTISGTVTAPAGIYEATIRCTYTLTGRRSSNDYHYDQVMTIEVK